MLTDTEREQGRENCKFSWDEPHPPESFSQSPQDVRENVGGIYGRGVIQAEGMSTKALGPELCRKCSHKQWQGLKRGEGGRGAREG